MKIAYCMRVDVNAKPGGDLVQVQEYIHAGLRPGTDGKPRFTGEIVTDLQADLTRFDIIHLTNIDRPVDAYAFYLRAKAARRPMVFSTIHHSYAEIARYEQKGRGGLIGMVSGTMGFSLLESLRSLVRSFSYSSLLSPTVRMIGRGMLRTQAQMLMDCACVLVLTRKEARDLVAEFDLAENDRFVCIRNGMHVPTHSAALSPVEARPWDVAVVGRIEARKNQIAILAALEQLGLRGMFLGGENKNHAEYCARFQRAIARSQSSYLGAIAHEQVAERMRNAKVHVSASWFEVASLVDVEAALCGCVVVSSRCGGTSEILGDDAIYVDPGSQESIVTGIADAIERSRTRVPTIDSELAHLVFPWDHVGIALEQVYRDVLAKAKVPVLPRED